MTNSTAQIEGRNCDGCAVCCKALIIDDFKKPSNQWCRHCKPKEGCTIYQDRPQTCRSFHCGYLLIPGLSEAWKPSKSKLLITFEASANRISIIVDPVRSNAWREEPYYSRIKQWSTDAVPARGQVLVYTNHRTIAVLPDRDKDLGHVGPNQIIRTLETRGPRGIALDVVVVDRDDQQNANAQSSTPEKSHNQMN